MLRRGARRRDDSGGAIGDGGGTVDDDDDDDDDDGGGGGTEYSYAFDAVVLGSLGTAHASRLLARVSHLLGNLRAARRPARVAVAVVGAHLPVAALGEVWPLARPRAGGAERSFLSWRGERESPSRTDAEREKAT